MTPPKRRKRSGLSGVELHQTIQVIKGLIDKWRVEEAAAEEDEEADDQKGSEVSQLQDVLEMLTTKLDGPQTFSFSTMSEEHLDNMNISLCGVLKLNPASQSRAAETDSVGEDQHWSADGLYRHLCFLKRLVPRTNEAAIRLWINAYFYRVASMSPGSSTIILNVEHNVAPAMKNLKSLNSVSGFVNFMAISTSEANAQRLLQNSRLRKLSAQDHALFVTEAKGPDQILANHVPQAICEMYACAKHIEKTIIRGAVTNGYEWIFFVLKLNENGDGGEYFQSEGVGLAPPSRDSSSLIAAIIAYWIQHSHEEIGVDDYFTALPL